jgi:hypothetical protein
VRKSRNVRTRAALHPDLRPRTPRRQVILGPALFAGGWAISHLWLFWLVPRLRPGLTEVLVTGMLIRWISVSTPRTGRARDVLGHRAALFERCALRLPPSGGIEGIVVEGAKLMRVERTGERQHL